jgi:phage N-6-adenine-methyltransferase
MGTGSVHFSSKSPEWETPQPFFDTYDAEFGFEIDVCATPGNAKCPTFFSPGDDGLSQPWAPLVCWCNPPYGRAIRHWVEKAHTESQKGATVVCLIPARTDTSYWHDFIFPWAEVRFIRGRLKFGSSKNSAPFPSAVAIFRPNGRDQEHRGS